MSTEDKKDQAPTPPPDTPPQQPGPKIKPPVSQLVAEGIDYSAIVTKTPETLSASLLLAQQAAICTTCSSGTQAIAHRIIGQLGVPYSSPQTLAPFRLSAS